MKSHNNEKLINIDAVKNNIEHKLKSITKLFSRARVQRKNNSNMEVKK